jgi:hypothetical protein
LGLRTANSFDKAKNMISLTAIIVAFALGYSIRKVWLWTVAALVREPSRAGAAAR